MILRKPVSVFCFFEDTRVELVKLEGLPIVGIDVKEVDCGGGVIAFQSILQSLLSWPLYPHFIHQPSLFLVSFFSPSTCLFPKPESLLEWELLPDWVLERALLD